MRKTSNSDWFLIVVIVAALSGAGGGLKGCENTGSGNPAPKSSSVCNEYFKGGC